MTKLRNPLFSLSASGPLAGVITYLRRRGANVCEKKPELVDAKTPPQIYWRTMYQKCVDLWHLLTDAEKAEWESAARPRHMTGYAWYLSQCLRPNPGIYLPLAGGTMQGDIDMADNLIAGLPRPTDPDHAAPKGYVDALPVPYTQGARVYHSADQAIPNNTWTTLAFDSQRYDTDDIHDTVTNNSRLTCKTAGKYILVAGVCFAANAVGIRSINIKVNNTFTIAIILLSAASAFETRINLSTIYALAINDYTEIEVYQNCGSALNVEYKPADSPEFMMQRIG